MNLFWPQTAMTEEQIERVVERFMDALDSQLMGGTLSQIEYDRQTKLLNHWAEQQYANRLR